MRYSRCVWTKALVPPIAAATLVGLTFSIGDFEAPAMVSRPIAMVGDMAIPLMLLNLGVQLRTLDMQELGGATLAVAIRMGGGLMFALLYTAVLGCEGVDRNVILLSGVMPAAVINVVMAQKFETSPGLVASAIVLGTVAALVAVPGLLFFLL